MRTSGTDAAPLRWDGSIVADIVPHLLEALNRPEGEKPLAPKVQPLPWYASRGMPPNIIGKPFVVDVFVVYLGHGTAALFITLQLPIPFYLRCRLCETLTRAAI